MTPDIINILINDAGVSSEVGATASSKVKVFPVYCPKPEDNPFITVRATGLSSKEECRGGAIEYTLVYEVVSCAKNFKKAVSIATAVETALDFSNTVIDGIRYKSTSVVGYLEDYINDVGLYVIRQRFQIAHVDA